MKKIILALSIALPMTGFAQGNITSGSASQMSPTKKLGVYVGAEYMNLTDFKAKFELKGPGTFQDGSRESKSQGGTHMGFAGIKIGYKSIPERGLGFDGGLRLLETFVRSEWADNKVQIALLEANAVLAANSLFLGYAGLNYNKLSGTSQLNNDYKGMVGAQAGLGLRFNSDIAMHAGYTVTRTRVEDSDFAATLELSGFNTGLTYTF
jgi:hypothetical protein